MEDWRFGGQCAPDYMNEAGRPVRIGVRAGAVIQELRPWKIGVDFERQFHRTARQTAEQIFTLGGEDPPIGQHTVQGELRLAALEQVLSRKLGWNPGDPCASPVGQYAAMVSRMGSHTIVVNDGYCDADCGF